MDPKETLRLCDQAISDCDADAAQAYLNAYRGWRAKGGFEPLEVAGSGLHGDKFADYCANRLHSFRVSERTLDEFTTAYIEALLWSETGDNGEPLDAEFCLDDIDTQSLTSIVSDCADFQESNAELLADLDAAQCGRDFLLTRNRHGAGFWDRGLGDIGRKLTDASRPYGETHAYVGDDGKVHVS